MQTSGSLLHRMAAFTAIFALALLLPFGCSSDSDDGGDDTPPIVPPTPNEITGVAMFGSFSGGTVTVYPIDAAGNIGAEVGTATLDTGGAFTVQIGQYAGPVLIEVDGGTFQDIVGGTTPQTLAMHAVLAVSSGTPNVVVTPMSTWVAAHAFGDTTAQGFPGAIAEAILQLEGYFKITGIGTTVPALLDSVATPGNSANHGAIIAGLSQLASGLGVAPDALADAIASDVMDGMLNGQDAGAPITLGAGSLAGTEARSELAIAISDFLLGPANLSGLLDTDFVPLLDRLNAVPEPTLFVESIDVTPAMTSVAQGVPVQFTAMALMSTGINANVTNTASWDSSDTAVATINSSGLAMAGTTPGTTDITATQDGVQGMAQMTVTGVVLVSIIVTPADPTIFSGGSQQFTATGEFSDASMQNITGAVTWDSSNNAAATITPGGLATGQAAGGMTTITATQGAISGDTTLTVTPLAIVSIAVTPANIRLLPTQTQQYTAMATFNDASVQNVTGSVNWQSSNTGTATITVGGLAQAVTYGTTTISATDPATMVVGNTTLNVEVSYAADIQPIFNNNCISCHSGPAPTGSLDLTSRASLLAGGMSGQVVISGNPNNSILILRLEDPNPSFRMPQGGNPLPQAEIDLIRAWIQRGLKDN